MSIAEKYNIPAPRYTSYPTVPFWKESAPSQTQWLESVKKSYFDSGIKDGISLYIHLPFCESLCTYCGCNKRITKNHSVEESYIESLLSEWVIYTQHIAEPIKIKEIHLGGGTPTFFSAQNLQKLIIGLKNKAEFLPSIEMSFEGHPNNTTFNHLMTLANLRFNRVSYGIQDFDEKVQKAIHRIQPISNVERATEQARQLGYKSVNFDLVYGLPFQTVESLGLTIDRLEDFMPERIALYSYAHVPWKSPSQRGYSDADLPAAIEKDKMYHMAKKKLIKMGYLDVGMDHFALLKDGLAQAYLSGQLNRNFMGYTTTNAEMLIGLGCSAISDSGYAFVQNEKQVEPYKEAVNRGELPLIKGHFMSKEDREIRKFIKELICNSKADASGLIPNLSLANLNYLSDMERDGLISIANGYISVKEKGRSFVRLVCMQFDKYLATHSYNQPIFSKAV